MKRKILNLLTVIFVLILAVFPSVFVVANAENYGFNETFEMTREEQEEFWEKRNFRILNNDYYTISKIFSYDVSENEEVIIGLYDNIIKTYDSNGNLMKTYTLDLGGLYYVKWHGNNIVLYLVRASSIVEITRDGELVNVTQIDESGETAYISWQEITHQGPITVNGNVYQLENNFLNFISNGYKYCMLTKTDKENNVTYIYDVRESQNLKVIFILICVLGLLSVSVTVVINGCVKFNKEKRERYRS